LRRSSSLLRAALSLTRVMCVPSPKYQVLQAFTN
jgi:hypothetical protein